MSSTTLFPTPNLDPLGLSLCTHFHHQLSTAHRHATSILEKRSHFTRTTYKAAFRDPCHPSRDAMELSVYKYQSLYELLGKSIHQMWSRYRRELYLPFPTIGMWVYETKPTMREWRNTIAHRFNTGTYFEDVCEGEELDEEARRNREFSAGKFWDFLEDEVPRLEEELRVAVEVFEKALRVVKEKVYVKSEFKLEAEREKRLWEVRVDLEIPEEWVQSGDDGFPVEVQEPGAWECAGFLHEEIVCTLEEQSGDAECEEAEDEGFFEKSGSEFEFESDSHSEPDFEVDSEAVAEEVSRAWDNLDAYNSSWAVEEVRESTAKLSLQEVCSSESHALDVACVPSIHRWL